MLRVAFRRFAASPSGGKARAFWFEDNVEGEAISTLKKNLANLQAKAKTPQTLTQQQWAEAVDRHAKDFKISKDKAEALKKKTPPSLSLSQLGVL